MSRKSSVLSAAVDRTVRRYRGVSRFGQAYVASKLRFDPVYADLLGLPDARFGRVIDLGCGRGQLGVLLLEAGAAEAVTAIDCQGRLLAEAERAGQGLALTVRRGDLGETLRLPQADTVFLIDVLYQLGTEAQRAVLDRVTQEARRVVIRTGDPARGWRSALTAGVERFSRRVWPHAGAAVNLPPVERLVAALSRAGFAVTVTPCWRGTPFCNVLIDARRRPDSV